MTDAGATQHRLRVLGEDRVGDAAVNFRRPRPAQLLGGDGQGTGGAGYVVHDDHGAAVQVLRRQFDTHIFVGKALFFRDHIFHPGTIGDLRHPLPRFAVGADQQGLADALMQECRQ